MVSVAPMPHDNDELPIVIDSGHAWRAERSWPAYVQIEAALDEHVSRARARMREGLASLGVERAGPIYDGEFDREPLMMTRVLALMEGN